MIAALALVAALAADTVDLPGRDKVKHFTLSAMVQSVVYSAARAARLDRGTSQSAGGALVIGIGIAKEVRDARRGRFSVADIVFGVAGGIAAAALLNGTR